MTARERMNKLYYGDNLDVLYVTTVIGVPYLSLDSNNKSGDQGRV